MPPILLFEFEEMAEVSAFNEMKRTGLVCFGDFRNKKQAGERLGRFQFGWILGKTRDRGNIRALGPRVFPGGFPWMIFCPSRLWLIFLLFGNFALA